MNQHGYRSCLQESKPLACSCGRMLSVDEMFCGRCGIPKLVEESDLQVAADASDIVMDFAPRRESSVEDMNAFGMPDEEDSQMLSAKTQTNQSIMSTKTETNQSLVSNESNRLSRTGSNHTQDSTIQYAQPDQTVIFFDWDDTLNPSTSCRTLCGKPGRTNLNFEAPGELELALQEHALEAKALIEKARELAHKVVVVTNGVESWVQSSCSAYLPSLLEALSQIDVFSARSEWLKTEGTEEASPANMKERTFEEVSAGFYSRYPNQSWKNIVSIGDHTDEREALERMARKSPSEKKCRLKAVKFIKRPSIKELTQELQLLRERLEEIVEHEDNLEMHLRRVMCRNDVSISNVEDMKPEDSQHTKFGLTMGEEVLWRKADAKILAHMKGIVIGFTIDRVCVRFPTGKFMFEPADLVSMSHILAVQSWKEQKVVEAARTIAFRNSNVTAPCVIRKGTLGILVDKVQSDYLLILFAEFASKDAGGLNIGDEVEVLPGVEMMWNGEECYKEGDRGVICKNAHLECNTTDDHGTERFSVKWHRSGLTSSMRLDAWRSSFRLVSADVGPPSLGAGLSGPEASGADIKRLLEVHDTHALSTNVAYACSSLTSISTINSCLRPGAGIKWRDIHQPTKLKVALKDSRWVQAVDTSTESVVEKQRLPMDEVLDGLKRCRISMY